jgi:hypothetical protein
MIIHNESDTPGLESNALPIELTGRLLSTLLFFLFSKVEVYNQNANDMLVAPDS